MRRRWRILLPVAVGGALALATMRAAEGAPATPHPARTPPSTSIGFALSLKMDEAGLERFVAASHDPRSPLFGRTLTAAAVGARFGLPLGAIERLERVLAARGVTVTAGYPQRTELDARAPVRTLERLFAVRFHDVTGPGGRLYPAPSGPPVVPRALRRWIDGVVGLDTRPRQLPDLLFPLRPQDVAAAYDLGPLRRNGFTGAGQTIAVISFQDFSREDLRLFERRFGVGGPEPRVPCCGRPDDPGSDEANLDVQAIRGVAPNAKIVVYEGPKTDQGELAMLNHFASGPAAVGSYSWGFCDDRLPAGDPYRQAVNRALAAAEANGKTLFVASGDQGAYECQRQDFSDHRLTVSFPADNAHVVSVGGTLLGLTNNGAYAGEAAWVEPLTYSGGGGGVSPADPKPSWQRGIVPGARRGVPDVSAVASGGSPWLIALDGAIGDSWGTSAAAPFWAAATAVTQQYAAAKGVQARCFLAPILYHVGSTSQPHRPFHDITRGTNRYYRARPGWDYATGLGSPDVWNLARDIVSYLRATPGACRH